MNNKTKTVVASVVVGGLLGGAAGALLPLITVGWGALLGASALGIFAARKS